MGNGISLAPELAMTTNIVTMVFAILLGLLVLGTLGSFLLVVPALPMLSVTAILLALIFMFALGCYAGGRRIRISHLRRLVHH